MNIKTTVMDVALQNIHAGISQVLNVKMLLAHSEAQLRNFVEDYNTKRENLILSKWEELKSRGWGWCETGHHFVFSKNLIGIHIRERYAQRCGYQGGEIQFDVREEHLTCCKKCFEYQKTRCYDEQSTEYSRPQHLYFLVDEYDVNVGPKPRCEPNFRVGILKRWKIPEHAHLDSNFMSHEKCVQIGDQKFSLTPVYNGPKIDYAKLEELSYTIGERQSPVA